MYQNAHTAAIRLNPKTFTTFNESSGFTICAKACKQGDPVLLKRTLFLFSSLLQPQDDSALEVSGGPGSVANTTMNAIFEHGILGMTLELLDCPEQVPLDDSLSFLLAVSLYNSSALQNNEKSELLEKLAIVERVCSSSSSSDIHPDDQKELAEKISHLRKLLLY